MMRIGNLQVGEGAPPFIIAELSGNHDGSLDKALAIVDAIAVSGAQALKLQTYTADTMTIDLAEREFVIDNPQSLWAGRNLYSLYEQAHTPWEWHAKIFARARQHGLIAFSTPFDASAVDFLESLDVPAYKIASFENRDRRPDPACRLHGQAGNHFHRARHPLGDCRCGVGGPRRGLPRTRIAQVHEQLPGNAVVLQPADVPYLR